MCSARCIWPTSSPCLVCCVFAFVVCWVLVLCCLCVRLCLIFVACRRGQSCVSEGLRQRHRATRGAFVWLVRSWSFACVHRRLQACVLGQRQVLFERSRAKGLVAFRCIDGIGVKLLCLRFGCCVESQRVGLCFIAKKLFRPIENSREFVRKGTKGSETKSFLIALMKPHQSSSKHIP